MKLEDIKVHKNYESESELNVHVFDKSEHVIRTIRPSMNKLDIQNVLNTILNKALLTPFSMCNSFYFHFEGAR